MRKITDRHEIEVEQAKALPRLVNDWALLTAGTTERFNTMTIAWGSLGDMYWEPVVDVYVYPERYTYGFMQESDWFTVSLFPEGYHDDLQILGSRSGRDGDKLALTKLTPLPVGHGVTFAEADVTFVCRKVFAQQIDRAALPEEIVAEYYETMGPHVHFVGAIEEVLVG